MTRLGRYEIVKSLARGGMAELLLARATGIQAFERHVVVKRIRPDLADDARFVQMFLEEARLAASLHHQHIVQVHDVGEQDGSYFFAMEYVHGEDLRAIVEKVSERRELVPVEIVCQIIAAAAAGLHHAHEKVGPDRKPLGLVHRDVSPGNVLVGYDGGVKLVDFGLAKAALRSAVTTRAGTLKGKAGYMSPEQCRGVPLDRRSDVFTLGIVLYELLTARRLFKASNDYQTMSAIVQSDVPPPSSHRADISRELDEIVLRALAKEPGARYQSADELRGALERYVTEAELRSSPKHLADYMRGLFGERPEPWLVPREPVIAPAATPSTGSGIVEPPAALEATIVTAQSPLALAIALAKEQDNAFIDEGATILEPAPDFTGDDGSTTATAVAKPNPRRRPEDQERAVTATGEPDDLTSQDLTISKNRKDLPLDDAPTTIAPPLIAIAPTETIPPPITLSQRVRSTAFRPLAIAAAALVALVVIAIAVETCGRSAAPASSPAAVDGGIVRAPLPDADPAPPKPKKTPRRLR